MNKKTKYMNSIEDPTMNRFFSWIELNGGVKKIANSIGRSEQTLYSYTSKSFPNFKLMCELKAVFPELDLNYLATGVEGSLGGNREKELQLKIEELEATLVIFKKVALSKIL
jgi:hypothetical protein